MSRLPAWAPEEAQPRLDGDLSPYPSVRELGLVAPIAMMPRLDWSLRGIAYHEAGHAVMMHLFRLRQDGAEATESGGRVNVDLPPREAADVEVPAAELYIAALRVAAMFMAGIVAQMMKDGLALEGAILSDSSDWVSAERVLDGCGVVGCATGRLFYCQRFARAVLSRHWAAVEAVATALETRGTLTGAEVAALCDGSPLRYHA